MYKWYQKISKKIYISTFNQALMLRLITKSVLIVSSWYSNWYSNWIYILYNLILKLDIYPIYNLYTTVHWLNSICSMNNMHWIAIQWVVGFSMKLTKLSPSYIHHYDNLIITWYLNRTLSKPLNFILNLIYLKFLK